MSGLRLMLATVLTATALGACSGDPEPKVADPTPSPATPSTISGSVTALPVPTADPQATIQAWIEAQNAALRDGDTDGLRALSSLDCTGCESFPEGIEKVYAAGGSYQGGTWELVNAHVRSASEERATYSAAVIIAAGKTIPAADAEPVVYEAANHLMEFKLVKDGDRWLFAVIAFIS